MISTILVPLDGSAHSRKALEFACTLAEKYGANLHVLHVTQQPVSDQVLALGSAPIMAAGTPADLDKAGRSVVEAAEDMARRRGIEGISGEVTSGDPARRVLDRAKEMKADVIVMGSRGLGDLSGMLVGSVSHKVGQHAPCTCITVK